MLTGTWMMGECIPIRIFDLASLPHRHPADNVTRILMLTSATPPAKDLQPWPICILSRLQGFSAAPSIYSTFCSSISSLRGLINSAMAGSLAFSSCQIRSYSGLRVARPAAPIKVSARHATSTSPARLRL